MESVEELLLERYKVIAPYPESRFETGDILIRYYFDNGNYLYTTNPKSPLEGISMNKECTETMPHLFQPLAWYAEREVSEMPEFVKGGGNYYKHEYCIIEGRLMFNQYCNGHPIGWLPVNKEFDFYTPVSEKEYNEYKQLKVSK